MASAAEAHLPKARAKVRADLAVHPPGLPRPSPAANQSNEKRRQHLDAITKLPDYKQESQAARESPAGSASSPAGSALGKGAATAPAAARTASQRPQPAQTCCLEADDFASTMLVGLFPVRSSPSSSSPSKHRAATSATSSQSPSPQKHVTVQAAPVQGNAPSKDVAGSEAEFEDDFESDEEAGNAAEDKVSQSAGKCDIEEVPWQDLMEISMEEQEGVEKAEHGSGGAGDTGGMATQPSDLPASAARDANPGAPAAATPPVMDLLADLPQEVLSPVPVANSKQGEGKLAPTTVPWPLGLEPPASQMGSLASASPSAAVVDDEQNCDMDLNKQTTASASGTSVTASVIVAGSRRYVNDMERQTSDEIEDELDGDGKVEDRANTVLTEGAAPRESIDAFLSSLAKATAALDKTWTPHLPRMETLSEEEQAPPSQVLSAAPRTRPLSRPQSPRRPGLSLAATASKRRQRGPAQGSSAQAVARSAAQAGNEEAEDVYSDDGFEEESSEDEDGRDTACSSPPSPAAVGRSVRLTRQSPMSNPPVERLSPSGARRPAAGRAPRPVKVHKAYSHDARKAYMRALELLPHPTPASARHRPAPEPPPRGQSTPALRPVRGKVGVRGSRNSRGGHAAAVPGSLAYSLRQASTGSIAKSCPNLLSRPRMR